MLLEFNEAFYPLPVKDSVNTSVCFPRKRPQ
jgi:hypothetical protein